MEQFDVDLDFLSGRLRLWKLGDGEIAARAANMVEVPAARLPSGGLGVRVTGHSGSRFRPFIGVVSPLPYRV